MNNIFSTLTVTPESLAFREVYQHYDSALWFNNRKKHFNPDYDNGYTQDLITSLWKLGLVDDIGA